MVADCTETELQELKNEAIQKVLLAYNNNVNISKINDFYYEIQYIKGAFKKSARKKVFENFILNRQSFLFLC